MQKVIIKSEENKNNMQTIMRKSHGNSEQRADKQKTVARTLRRTCRKHISKSQEH